MDCQKYVLWNEEGNTCALDVSATQPSRGTPVVRLGGGLWSSSRETGRGFLEGREVGMFRRNDAERHPRLGEQLLEGQAPSLACGTPLGSWRWGWQRMNTEGEIEWPSRGWMGEPRLWKSAGLTNKGGWAPGVGRPRGVRWGECHSRRLQKLVEEGSDKKPLQRPPQPSRPELKTQSKVVSVEAERG